MDPSVKTSSIYWVFSYTAYVVSVLDLAHYFSQDGYKATRRQVMPLHYEESGSKATFRPRHPIVCFLDMVGIVMAMFFLFQSTHVAVQSYLLSIVLLYVISALHHWLTYKDWSRRLDHIMIFVVIAMTALPYWGAYPPLRWSPAGPVLIAVIIALGVTAKLISYYPKVLSATLYTVAGLPMVSYFILNWSNVPEPYNVLWIFGVGLYVFQMLIYTFHWFDFKAELFGFREIQHIILLTATTIHSAIAVYLVG